MKAILTILFVLFSFNYFGANFDGGTVIYKHLGWAQYTVNNNTEISFEAYITKTKINDYNRKSLVEYKFLYEIVLISHSKNNGIPTETWLDGARIYLNGIETSEKQYPNGFTILIKKEPTVVYWLEMNDESPNISIKWDNAEYESTK